MRPYIPLRTAIHVLDRQKKDVDARDNRRHDVEKLSAPY
jgi:hypothetical protein